MLNRDVEEDEEDGGVERGVKGFSRKMSYLSFAFRVSPMKIICTAICLSLSYLFSVVNFSLI